MRTCPNLPLLLGCSGWLIALCLSVYAQSGLTDTSAVRSFSGQFIIRGASGNSPPGRQPDFGRDEKHLTLQPSLLAISCERIKQSIESELGDKSEWRGKIFVSLSPARTTNDEIAFVAERFKDGWAYQLDVPSPVERTRLVRAVVQALLTEHANRNSDPRSAEIPLWLVEGLTQQLVAGNNSDLLLAPPQRVINRVPASATTISSRLTNSVALARLSLGERGAMSLEELSWPKENQLSGPDADTYSHSAQLFVGELLRFEDGPGCLRTMIEELSGYYNWQMAFLRGFKSHFAKQLEVEKWWALQVEFSSGRNANGRWSSEESWAKLDEILRAPVEMRRGKGDLPSATEVPLTTVVREWDFARQSQTLQKKLTELDGALGRISAEFLPLVDGYRLAISDYLEKRKRVGAIFSTGKVFSPSARGLVRDALKRFESLELQRQNLKPKAVTPVASVAPDSSPAGEK